MPPRLTVIALEDRLNPNNTLPTISEIPDQVIWIDEPAQLTFFVNDLETPSSQILVEAFSSEPNVLLDSELVLEGSGAERTLAIFPDGTNQAGTTFITIRATDTDQGVTEQSFLVELLQPEIAIPAGMRIPAGEFNWFQPTPDGSLAQLVWAGDVLVYRTREFDGWHEVAITQSSDYQAFPTYENRDEVQFATQSAQLLMAPSGPNAFVVGSTVEMAGESILSEQFIDHFQQWDGSWQWVDRLVIDDLTGNAGPIMNLTGAVGPGGVMHLALDQTMGFDAGRVLYLTDRDGDWTITEVAQTGYIADDVGFIGGRYAPRYLSLAADSYNDAHLTFSYGFESEDFGVVYSALGYASNMTGSWQTELVYEPPTGLGDAALGSSVAIGPNDEVYIASYFVDRFETGSPISAQLLFHIQTEEGWWTEVVADLPDGYVGDDGPYFTGFHPHLSIFGNTPVIVFSDVAGWHLPFSSANEMSGQIRLAWLPNMEGDWVIDTLYRQEFSLTEQIFFPVVFEFQGQPVVGALEAFNTIDADGELTGWAGFELFELNAPSLFPIAPAPGTPGGPLGAGTVGAGTGLAPFYQVYDNDGYLVHQTLAFAEWFSGGVRIASADFNGDGILDTVVATGPGVPTLVRILDGQTREELFYLEPFEESFLGGVYVAAGDLNGDGVPDLIITPDEGGGPRVRIFNGARGFIPMQDFFGIDDPNFRGGARPAVGDINGDGIDDLVVAAGFQGGPRVAGYNGLSLAFGRAPQRVFADFFAFESTLRNGVYIAVGDLDGDGFAELIAGGGPGGGPRVTAFSGLDLLGNAYVPVANFFAGDPNNRSGVTLATRFLDNDDLADLMTGSGEGAGTRVTAYTGLDILDSPNNPAAWADFNAYGNALGGVYVG